MAHGQSGNDAGCEFAPDKCVKAEQKKRQGNNEERGENHIRRPVRSGHDAGKRDKGRDKEQQRAAFAVECGEHGGETEHVRGVAGGERFAGLGRRGDFGRADTNRFGQGENFRFDGGEADDAGGGEGFRGPRTAEGALEGVDEEAFDQRDGKQQADDHGAGAETALPDDQQGAQHHDGKPKIQAREHGHELVESGPAAVGVEMEEQTLVERGRHVW